MIMFTIRHTFESIEAAGSDLFSKPEKFYHYRDGFFEFVKLPGMNSWASLVRT